LTFAATRDINSCSLFFPEQRFILSHFWVPEGSLKARIREKRTRLDGWAQAKVITVTPGDAADYDRIEEDVLRLAGMYSLRVLGVDMWNSLQVVQHLMDEGIEVGKVGQGYQSLNAPMKLLERMLVRKEIFHDGNPVMRWMFGNIAVKQDPAGNIKPDRSKAAEKIDGVVSLIMALAAWLAGEEAMQGKVDFA
jgi:phage terminase large subunit-like protein